MDQVPHYFDEHRITIVSSAPLADILKNPGATGRVAEWNIELSPRDLQFKHPPAIKPQVLPDFLVEWTEVQTPGPPDLSNSWTMFFDGCQNPNLGLCFSKLAFCIMKKIAKEKEMGKRKALNELNKKARNKSFSKIILDVLKNPKNECGHFKSDLGLIPCS